jgi:hypothetical protein
MKWNIARDEQTFTASILREQPAAKALHEGSTHSYRVIVTCRQRTREGEIRIAGADAPVKEGTISSVSVDGAAPFNHILDGSRAQGNFDHGPGATVLKIGLPRQSLVFANTFPDGRVEFPFADLNASARQELAACFTETKP